MTRNMLLKVLMDMKYILMKCAIASSRTVQAEPTFCVRTSGSHGILYVRFPNVVVCQTNILSLGRAFAGLISLNHPKEKRGEERRSGWH